MDPLAPTSPGPAADAPTTLLISVVGGDRPGVTSAVFNMLTSYAVEVVDIEQIVVRGQLVLALLVTAPRDWKGLRDKLHSLGDDLGMQINVDRGKGDNE